MNEYSIYFFLLILTLIFQSFWSWCNSTKKPTEVKEEKKDKQREDLINFFVERGIEKALEEAEKRHQQEIRQINAMHKQTLKKKATAHHKSCEKRNVKIQKLAERVEALKKANAQLQRDYTEFKENTIEFINDWG